jgi:hypothetical protein
MKKVVETSFHHINGKHGKSGRGGHTVNPRTPCQRIFLQNPYRSEIASDRRMQVRLTKEDADARP